MIRRNPSALVRSSQDMISSILRSTRSMYVLGNKSFSNHLCSRYVHWNNTDFSFDLNLEIVVDPDVASSIFCLHKCIEFRQTSLYIQHHIIMISCVSPKRYTRAAWWENGTARSQLHQSLFLLYWILRTQNLPLWTGKTMIRLRIRAV